MQPVDYNAVVLGLVEKNRELQVKHSGLVKSGAPVPADLQEEVDQALSFTASLLERKSVAERFSDSTVKERAELVAVVHSVRTWLNWVGAIGDSCT